MLHSFVVAKVLPRLSFRFHSPCGERVAASFVTRPFLALHLHPNDREDFIYRTANLFVVSQEKPISPGSQYLVLNSNSGDLETGDSEKSLTVDPPLPFKGPLYLSITPRISAAFPDKDGYERLVKAEKYQLDEASVDRFREALKEAKPSVPAPTYTGGDDEPGTKWDTWSCETHRSGNYPFARPAGRRIQFNFDLLPFETLANAFESAVFEEMSLLRQLNSDYIWDENGLVTGYIEQMRKTLHDMPRLLASGKIFRPPTLGSSQNRLPDPSIDALRPCTAHLQSLPIIHDGEPGDEDEDSDEIVFADDLRDDIPTLRLPMAAPVPAVMANDVKVVLFDCNILVDRDGPLQEALLQIFSPTKHRFSGKELLDLYVEFETLRTADGLASSPISVLQCIAKYLGPVSLEESSVKDIWDRYAAPRPRHDVQELVTGLIEHGYKPVGIPSTAPLEAVSPIRGLSLELYAIEVQNPGLTLETIISFCKELDPTIRLDQILLVTSDLYRQCEFASRTGLPTAFLRAAGTRSATLAITTTVPTMTLTHLDDLLPALVRPALVPTPRVPVLDSLNPPFHFHDSYQSTFLLGAGSCAWVWNGIQVHTGAGVAIKFELIGHPSEPETLPYEAAVYAQLEGVEGVPRIHWYGQEMNANVLVMDRLAPTLEQLRRFCRGRLSLKTVLMLGEQMLWTIEQVHARGVIVRDIKPDNFAPGLVEEYQRLYLFDMGLSKLYLDPSTGTHMPFRDGRLGVGTARYASHRAHLGLEISRRDDIEAMGNVLLYLLHGRLPWQGIVAPDIPAKMQRIGEMKRGKPFADFLARSPPCFVAFFEHCRSLEFVDKPDYALLRGLLRGAMEENGWQYDWEYDWWKPGERGTLLPEEYRLDVSFVELPRRGQDAL